MTADDRNQIKDLLEMEQLQAGLQLLVEKLPGFESFVQSMTGAGGGQSSISTTTTTTTVRDSKFHFQSSISVWNFQGKRASQFSSKKSDKTLLNPLVKTPDLVPDNGEMSFYNRTKHNCPIMKNILP